MWKKKNDSFRKSLNRRVTPPFTAKAHRFQTAKRILMFENTSPTLLDTRDVFRIRF